MPMQWLRSVARSIRSAARSVSSLGSEAPRGQMVRVHRCGTPRGASMSNIRMILITLADGTEVEVSRAAAQRIRAMQAAQRTQDGIGGKWQQAIDRAYGDPAFLRAVN